MWEMVDRGAILCEVQMKQPRETEGGTKESPEASGAFFALLRTRPVLPAITCRLASLDEIVMEVDYVGIPSLSLLPRDLLKEIGCYLSLSNILQLFGTLNHQMRRSLCSHGLFPSILINTYSPEEKWLIKDWFKSVEGGLQEVVLNSISHSSFARIQSAPVTYQLISNVLNVCKNIDSIRFLVPIDMATLPARQIARASTRAVLRVPHYGNLFPNLRRLYIGHAHPIESRAMKPEFYSAITCAVFSSLPRSLESFEWEHHAQLFHVGSNWNLLPQHLTQLTLLSGYSESVQMPFFDSLKPFSDLFPRLNTLRLQLDSVTTGPGPELIEPIANPINIFPNAINDLVLVLDLRHPLLFQWPESLSSLRLRFRHAHVPMTPEVKESWQHIFGSLPESLLHLTLDQLPLRDGATSFWSSLPTYVSSLRLHASDLNDDSLKAIEKRLPYLGALYEDAPLIPNSAVTGKSIKSTFPTSLTELELADTVLTPQDALKLPPGLRKLRARFRDAFVLSAARRSCPNCQIISINKIVPLGDLLLEEPLLEEGTTTFTCCAAAAFVLRVFGEDTICTLEYFPIEDRTAVSNPSMVVASKQVELPKSLTSVSLPMQTRVRGKLVLTCLPFCCFVGLPNLTSLTMCASPTTAPITEADFKKLPPQLLHLDLGSSRLAKPFHASCLPLSLVSFRSTFAIPKSYVSSWTKFPSKLQSLIGPNICVSWADLSKLPSSLTEISFDVDQEITDWVLQDALNHFPQLKSISFGKMVRPTTLLLSGGLLPPDYQLFEFSDAVAQSMKALQTRKIKLSGKMYQLALPKFKWEITPSSGLRLPSNLTRVDLSDVPSSYHHKFVQDEIKWPDSVTSLALEVRQIPEKFPGCLTALSLRLDEVKSTILWPRIPDTLTYLYVEQARWPIENRSKEFEHLHMPLPRAPPFGIPCRPLTTLLMPAHDLWDVSTLDGQMPSLTRLHLHGGGYWTDVQVQKLVAQLPNLTSLEFSHPIRFTAGLVPPDIKEADWQSLRHHTMSSIEQGRVTSKFALGYDSGRYDDRCASVSLPKQLESLTLCATENSDLPLLMACFVEFPFDDQPLPTTLTSLEFASLRKYACLSAQTPLPPSLTRLVVQSNIELRGNIGQALPRTLLHLRLPQARASESQPTVWLDLPPQLEHFAVPFINIPASTIFPQTLRHLDMLPTWSKTEIGLVRRRNPLLSFPTAPQVVIID